MQNILIITKVERLGHSVQSGGLQLFLTDHLQRSVVVIGTPEQQINIQSLQNQVLPIVMLSDQLETMTDNSIQVPSTALVSVVPIASTSILVALEAGKANDIIQLMQAR